MLLEAGIAGIALAARLTGLRWRGLRTLGLAGGLRRTATVGGLRIGWTTLRIARLWLLISTLPTFLPLLLLELFGEFLKPLTLLGRGIVPPAASLLAKLLSLLARNAAGLLIFLEAFDLLAKLLEVVRQLGLGCGIG